MKASRSASRSSLEWRPDSHSSAQSAFVGVAGGRAMTTARHARAMRATTAIAIASDALYVRRVRHVGLRLVITTV